MGLRRDVLRAGKRSVLRRLRKRGEQTLRRRTHVTLRYAREREARAAARSPGRPLTLGTPTQAWRLSSVWLSQRASAREGGTACRSARECCATCCPHRGTRVRRPSAEGGAAHSAGLAGRSSSSGGCNRHVTVAPLAVGLCSGVDWGVTPGGGYGRLDEKDAGWRMQKVSEEGEDEI